MIHCQLHNDNGTSGVTHCPIQIHCKTVPKTGKIAIFFKQCLVGIALKFCWKTPLTHNSSGTDNVCVFTKACQKSLSKRVVPHSVSTVWTTDILIPWNKAKNLKIKFNHLPYLWLLQLLMRVYAAWYIWEKSVVIPTVEEQQSSLSSSQHQCRASSLSSMARCQAMK